MGLWLPSKMQQGTMSSRLTTLGVAQIQLMMGGKKRTLLKDTTGTQHLLTLPTPATSLMAHHGARCQQINKSSGLIAPQIPLFTAEKSSRRQVILLLSSSFIPDMVKVTFLLKGGVGPKTNIVYVHCETCLLQE